MEEGRQKLTIGVVCDESVYRELVDGILEGKYSLDGYIPEDREREDERVQGYKFFILNSKSVTLILGQVKCGKISSSIISSNLLINDDITFLLCITRFVCLSQILSTKSLVISKGVIQHDVDIRPWYPECVSQCVQKLVVPVNESFSHDISEAAKNEITDDVIVGVNASGDVYVTSTEAIDPKNKIHEHLRRVSSDVDFCDTISGAVSQLAYETKVECGVVGVSQDGCSLDLFEILKMSVDVISRNKSCITHKE